VAKEVCAEPFSPISKRTHSTKCPNEGKIRKGIRGGKPSEKNQ